MGNQYQEPDYWSRKAFSEGYPARSVYKLEEMQKMPSYKKDGKKIKGSFSKIVKDMRADFKVLGERSKKNKHNGQMYPVLKSGEIKIESKIAAPLDKSL